MFWLSPENRIEACEVSLCITNSALFLKHTNGDLNWLFDYTIYPVDNYEKFISTQLKVSVETLFSLLKTGKMYHRYFEFQWKRQKQKNSNFFQLPGPVSSPALQIIPLGNTWLLAWAWQNKSPAFYKMWVNCWYDPALSQTLTCKFSPQHKDGGPYCPFSQQE